MHKSYLLVKEHMKFKPVNFSITMVTSFGIFAAGYIYQNYHEKSLTRALQYYGFTTQMQKQALEDLFKTASIIPVDTTWDKVFPTRKSDNELARDFLTIVEETQKKLTIRTGTQERWEVQPSDWMQKNNEKIFLNLNTLGFIKAIHPKNKNPDAICILGAARERMAARIKYTDDLISTGLQTKAFVLLAGERQVTENIDGSAKELAQIANKFGIEDWKKLTETYLMHDLFNQSTLSTCGIPPYVIDTPAKNLPRPTTQTTILELISWLKKHPEINSILFVSNQPYVHYQQAIINSIFKEHQINIKYEVIGSAVQNNKVQPILEGLGTYIWTMTPSVINKMNLMITDTELKALFKINYAKNPLIYQNLPKNLKFDESTDNKKLV